MPAFSVHHTTTYRYRQAVGFGEHRLVLRPAGSHDQRLVAADLAITPEPASLHWREDEFGNWVGTARFSGRSKILRVQSVLRVEQTPWRPGDGWPAGWPSADPARESLSPFLQRRDPDPDGAVADWARGFLAALKAEGTLAALAAMSKAIHSDFTYVRREEKGVQEPAVTLGARAGSCRDLAVLMIDAARALKIPARFASGYLHLASRSGREYQGGGSTHAWAQAWVPGTGWTDFDPTNNLVGNRDLIRIATAPEPAEVLPLSGTFIGFPDDQLGMQVSVRVEAGDDIRLEPLRRLVL